MARSLFMTHPAVLSQSTDTAGHPVFRRQSSGSPIGIHGWTAAAHGGSGRVGELVPLLLALSTQPDDLPQYEGVLG